MTRKLTPLLIVCAFHIVTSIGLAQSVSTNSNQITNTQSADEVTSNDSKNLREGLKTIAEGSRTLIGWGLAIIAASVAAIVSTSYIRPHNKKIRLIYLLFIPGWLLISLSIYYGDKVSRRYIAATLVTKNEILRAIGNNINSEFSSQLAFLQLSLFFFSIWLLLFLLWWVFGSWSTAAEQPS